MARIVPAIETPSMRMLFPLLMAGAALCTPQALPAQDTLSLSCAVCHGTPDRRSGVPDVYALSAVQIDAALRAYRDGTRNGTAMPRLSRSLSDAEIQALAQRFGRGPR